MELIVAPITELRARMSEAFEAAVAERLQSEPAATGRFACGITGGSTALIFLGALRDAHVDWSRINIYWGDERAVAPDHPDSNFGLAEQVLLQPLGGRAPTAVRMMGEAEDLAAAAADYEARLRADLSRGALDLIILGIGEDGHICSLFPGHDGLAVADRWVMAIDDSPKPPSSRLTLTMPFVLAAAEIWVVVVGARKLPVLQHAVARQTAETPLDLVVAHGARVTIFTDQAVRSM
jgi:6-phosphogluconolactonase